MGQNNMFLKAVISQNFDDRSTKSQDKKCTPMVLLFPQFFC